MTLIIVIIVLLLLFGGGGGYYAHRSYGAPGLGGVLGLVVVVLILLWLFGGGTSLGFANDLWRPWLRPRSDRPLSRRTAAPLDPSQHAGREPSEPSGPESRPRPAMG